MPFDIELPGKNRGWSGAMIVFRGQLYRSAWVKKDEYVLEYPCGRVVRIPLVDLHRTIATVSCIYYGYQEPSMEVLVSWVNDEKCVYRIAACSKQTGQLTNVEWFHA